MKDSSYRLNSHVLEMIRQYTGRPIRLTRFSEVVVLQFGITFKPEKSSDSRPCVSSTYEPLDEIIVVAKEIGRRISKANL